MNTNNLIVQDKTLVLTCTDFFHPFLQQPHYTVFRAACNCVTFNNANALNTIAVTVKQNNCKEILVVGHVSCAALEYNMRQILFERSQNKLSMRLGSILNSIVTHEPTLSLEEAIIKLTHKNIIYELDAVRQFFLNHMPELDIKISAAIFTEEDALVPIENETLIH